MYSPFIIHHFSTLSSTNDYLKSLTTAPEFTVVVADEQTAGRGRYDRNWHSTKGDGLYLSLLLRPARTQNLALLSPLTAVAVAETIVEQGASSVDIKWPNDVLIGERKVCGILIESVTSGRESPRVIVGIGVNLNHRKFPAELIETATSLLITTGRATDIAAFRDRLLARLVRWYETWRAGAEHLIVQRWEELSSYAYGCQIKIKVADEEIVGESLGLDPSGAFRVRTPMGKVRTLLVGEVSRLRRHEST